MRCIFMVDFMFNDEYILEIYNLWKRYETVTALRGLDFNVKYGEIHGLLGPNGAGKTTTLKIIVGLLKKDKGMVKVVGYNIDEEPFEYKRYIGYLPEYPNLPLYLTVEEFIKYVARIRDVPINIINDRMNDLLNRLEIGDKRNELIANLSKGMKQKVAIIASLIHKPKLIIMDEPFLGIDPMGQKTVKDILQEMINDGHSVLVSTHILDTAERLCDRVTIIYNGENLGTGTLDELRKHAEAEKGSTLEEIFIKLIEEASTEEEREEIQVKPKGFLQRIFRK